MHSSNMETPANTFQEINDPTNAPKKHGLEIVSGTETTKVTESLDTLHHAISHDTPITESNLSDLTTAIQGLSIDVGGTPMSIAEAEKIPDLKRNMEIFKEIQGGNVSNTEHLTFITPLIAEYLSKHKGYLDLSGLTTLTDTAAEHLSKHKGTLDLEGLTTLSDTAIESLSKHKGGLGLSGLTTITDTAAESLSKHKGGLGLSSLTTLTDTAAEHLSKHEGGINLSGLTTLSDTVAEYLSKHVGGLDVSDDILTRINAFKKYGK